ncbi:GerMN domain-containing protein [Blastococcus sp. CT_GayMR19]|uniref:GerMN domain-containing protein n=1 Tax=Blastococcus sp. CT_GayMR19 TaxID=2559608 RepID=UPI0014306878|nr:GerMN domain-containing protein [Blastococcus sp. CT_GayMR19]
MGDEPRAIPSSEVPYGLADRTPAPTAPSTAAPVESPSQIFLVGADEVLVGRPREVDGTTVRQRLADLLAQLEAGPSAAEQEEELSSVLTPEVRLLLTDLSQRTATIDISLPSGAPSGGASRRAVAQLVLTATSVTGVDAVRLTIDGDPVEAPLPTGELTSAPLTARDYAVFVTAPEVPPARSPSAVPAAPS